MIIHFSEIKEDNAIVMQTKITDLHLNQKRERELKKGKLQGAEQAFRDDYYWYRLNIGYTNPLNYKTIHAELKLIESILNQKNNLLVNAIYTKNKPLHQIFYGIGVGDTEIAFLEHITKIEPEKRETIFITGIDVNKNFIKNFTVALLNKKNEPHNKKIFFRAYNALFSQINKNELKFKKESSIHFCLGGTIGNFYSQEKIIRTFYNNMNKKDILVLGVQLNTHIHYLFKKYQSNPLYPDFILNYLPQEKRKLKWHLKGSTIVAEHNKKEVFRTKKYNSQELKEQMEDQGFTYITEYIDEYQNACLQIYEK